MWWIDMARDRSAPSTDFPPFTHCDRGPHLHNQRLISLPSLTVTEVRIIFILLSEVVEEVEEVKEAEGMQVEGMQVEGVQVVEVVE